MDDMNRNNDKNNKNTKFMKKLKIDKKYYYFAIMGLFLIVGISYAFIFFTERFEGNDLGFSTELLDVTITENGLVTMDNAIPQKDEEGLENERTVFNIVNNNRVPIRVVVKLVEDTNSTMNTDDVRFGIIANGKLMSVGSLEENDSILLDFQMDPGQDATLESTLWLDYYYNGGTTDEVFSGKYVVEASNLDDYGYMYLKNLVGKNKGLVAINTDGELAEEGDEIREYRYSGSAKYCTYTIDGKEYQLEVDGNECPSACYVEPYLYRYDNEYISVYGGSCPDVITPNQTTPMDGEVENYLWFNNEMWRIVGVFNETTGSGKNQELIKIIRDEPLLKEEVPNTYTYNGIQMTLKNTDDEVSKYSPVRWNYANYFNQTNQNDWTQSAVQYYLNDETSGANSYYNSIKNDYKKMIETVEYKISNVVHNTSTSEVYTAERSGNVHTGNESTWTGKIGLMYPSDYGYAASNSSWSTTMAEYGNINYIGTLSNWMKDDTARYSWTMSPVPNATNLSMFVTANGVLNYSNVQNNFVISPVLYLKSDVLITAGNGSEEKPYQVERPELVRIPTKATTTIKSKVGTDGLVAINTDGELASDGDTCPSACDTGTFLYRYDNEALIVLRCSTEILPNETIPLSGEVDNYVEYNGEIWRIIGVFNETTSSGITEELVKIIRDEPLLQDEVPETYTYNNVSMTLKNTNSPYLSMQYAPIWWNYSNYFGQSNSSDWTQSAIQYYLNDETSNANSYYNSIALDYREMIATVKYNLSNAQYQSNASVSYTSERSGNVWSGNQATWTGKIGMMYPSDFGYASSSGAWEISMYAYGNKEYSESLMNWINDDVAWREWLMSPTEKGIDGVFDIDYIGDVNNYNTYQYANAVSPVLYLKSSVTITSGNGSEEDPYKLG